MASSRNDVQAGGIACRCLYYPVVPWGAPDILRELEFVYTPLFDSVAANLLDDDTMRRVELALLTDPRAGAVVAGTGGIRKLRAPLPGRGKRGGARVLYVYVELRGRIYFLLAYAKNEQVDLTPVQKKSLSRMVTDMEELASPPK